VSTRLTIIWEEKHDELVCAREIVSVQNAGITKTRVSIYCFWEEDGRVGGVLLEMIFEHTIIQQKRWCDLCRVYARECSWSRKSLSRTLCFGVERG
jgi:hypothetical protein